MVRCNVNLVPSLYISMEGCCPRDSRLHLSYIIQILSEGGAIDFLMLFPHYGTYCYSIKLLLKHELTYAILFYWCRITLR